MIDLGRIVALLREIGVQPRTLIHHEELEAHAETVADEASVRIPPLEGAFADALAAAVANRPRGSVLLLPPFLLNSGLSSDVRESMDNFQPFEFVTLQIARTLGPDETLAVLLPANVLSDTRSRRFRETLANYADVQWIIELDNSTGILPDIHHAYRVAVLIIHLASGSASTKFVRIARGTSLNQLPGDFRLLRRMEGGRSEHGFVLRGKLDANTLWTYDANNPAIDDYKETLRSFGRVVPLGEVVSFPQALDVTADSDDLHPYEGHEGVPVLEGRGLLPEFKVSDEFRYRTSSNRGHLRTGDICIRSIGFGNLNPVIILSNMLPLAATRSVMILRPRDELDHDASSVIARYLGSEAVKPFLGAVGARLTVTKAMLSGLPIPLADDTLKQAIREIGQAADTFLTWKEESESALSDLFSFSASEESRPRLLSTGRRLRQRLRAASSVDQVETRIRATYPHPIAFRWRTVETSVPDLEGYQQVLEAAEITVCYLAQLSLVAAHSRGLQLASGAQLAAKVTTKNLGTTMGDWVAIYHELRTCHALRKIPTEDPFFELVKSVPIGGKGDAALTSLKKMRDDQAHQRGPRGAEIREAFQPAREALKVLLEELEFLSDNQLRYVERARRDTLKGTTHLVVRNLMGDHPLVPTEQIEIASFDVEEESLYFVDRDLGHHLLRPFLRRSECPKCHTWSTFYLDQVDRSGRCRLKSMEHGHTIPDLDFSPFAAAGFIAKPAKQ